MKGNALEIVRKLRNTRFQPPQGGPREKLRWINDGEADLLRQIGGSGKRGKFGFESFWLGDHANSVGSAGNSNYAGDAKGGQVNLDNVGGNTGNVLRSIAGKWTVVSANPQMQQASASRAPPVVPPAVPPVATLPPIPVGMNFANVSLPVPAAPSTFPARPAVIAPNSFKPAPSTFPSRPSVTAPNSFNSAPRPASSADPRAPTSADNASNWPGYQAPAPADQSSVVSHITMGKPFQGYHPLKDQSRIPVKDYDRLPGMTGATPSTPAYNPALVGNATYTPQAINDIRHNGGWIPDPVDAPRPLTQAPAPTTTGMPPKSLTAGQRMAQIANDARHRGSMLNRSRMTRGY